MHIPHASRAGGTLLDSVVQDIKYAWRTLGRNTGYTALAILTLTLGLGGAIAAFVIGDRVLLRPLPYPRPETLVSVAQTEGLSGGLPINIRQYAALRIASRSFGSLEALIPSERNLQIGDSLVPVQTAMVTGGFFGTLGIAPIAGRPIAPADTARGGAPVVVLSHSLWRRVFAGDMETVGRTITIANTPYTVIGIMPPTFAFPERTDLWTPCTWCERPPAASMLTAQIVGRLEGVSVADADVELALLWRRLHESTPARAASTIGRISAVPLQQAVVGSAARRIQLLGAGLAIVLLIGCVNLASATMARNVTRVRELALRAALGATRRRIVQQLAVESLLIAVAASLAGLALAAGLLRVTARLGAAYLPRVHELAIDGRTIAFALALAVAVAVLIGVLPALQAARRDLATHLAGFASRSLRGPRGRGRRLLLAAEIAMSLVVVAAAGLAARSLQLVYRQPIGIDTSGLATIRPQIDFRRYRTPESLVSLYDRLLARIASVPGVQGVGAAATVPLGEPWIGLIEIEGRPELRQPIGGYNLVTEGFFGAVGVPLLSGRLLNHSDNAGTEPVTVVNKAMADRYWPGRDPIGLRFRAVNMDRGEPVWYRIVGVVGNVRTLSLETRYQPIYYVSARQRPALLAGTTIIARTSGGASALLPGLRASLTAIDPQLRGTTATVAEMVAESALPRRQAAGVLAGFAVLVLALAGVGIYGTLAYNVAQRFKEIGIRMALGATAPRVVRHTLGELAIPVVLGIAAGLFAARAAARVLSGLVFGITPTDPLVLAAAAATLLTLALIAAYVPARRAMRVDPSVSLRAD